MNILDELDQKADIRHCRVFWHKYQQQKMSSPANFITNSVLRFPRGRLLSSYTRLFLTFLLSGIEHALSDVAQGLEWKQSGAVRFFCTQAVGIFAEDMIQALYSSIIRGRRKPLLPQSAVTLLGYVWVVLFMVWSTPVWTYPSLYANKGEEKDTIVPFSFVALFIRYVKSY